MSKDKKTQTWKYYVGYALSLSGASMVLWRLFGKEHFLYSLAFGLLLGAYNFHVDVNRNS